MTIAVGDLHDSVGQHEKAIAAYDRAIVAAAAQPESLLEVIQAKADVLVEMSKVDEALDDSRQDNRGRRHPGLAARPGVVAQVLVVARSGTTAGCDSGGESGS